MKPSPSQFGRVLAFAGLFAGLFAGPFPSLVAFASVAAPARQATDPDMGKIHGRVLNPKGLPGGGGTVSLSTDEGVTYLYDFAVSPTGEYSGQVLPAEYLLVYRTPTTPEGKVVDFIRGVEVVAGQDTKQDVDMSRKEFTSRLSQEQQKELEGAKVNTAAAPASNSEITGVNADLAQVNQDLQDVENARATAAKNLGADASWQDVELAAADIEKTKYSEIETLMSKDTVAAPEQPILWMDLAHAEIGLNELEDAENNYKKALDLVSKATKPDPILVAAAEAGLGEVYARSLMVDEANAAFEAAAKADPANAAVYLRNQAVLFYELKNAPAQADAAEEAIKADPTQAVLYFIKAQGLALNAPIDPDSNRIVLSPECEAAYRKYLELDPTGPHAADVTAILRKTGGGANTPGAGSPGEADNKDAEDKDTNSK
jgi:tetratricopeptide (TPR) repeat protein